MHDSELARFYHKYLDSQDTATFIQSVASRYDNATLAALASRGDVGQRRSAVLALGFLGNFRFNQVLGFALRDQDRGVRMVAEAGIGNLWLAAGTMGQRKQLLVAERLIAALQIPEALTICSRICAAAPDYGEAWRIHGVASFGDGRLRDARSHFRRTMLINPFQYQAATGLANCYIRAGDATGGLRWFRRALRINPDLELIRMHVARLSKSLEQP